MSNQKTSSSMLLTKKPVKNNYETLLFTKQSSPSLETVLYYGFTPIKSFRHSTLDQSAARATNSIDSIFGNPIHDSKCFCPKEKATLVKLYKNGHFKDLPKPLMVYQEKTNRLRSEKNMVSQKCSLDIIDVSGSIAEALAIQTSCAILEESGFKDLEIEINSVGDQASRNAFERDLSLYVRDIINSLPEQTKEMCKKNPYSLFASTEEEAKTFINGAPKPISYLSEESRTHLKEVLEYLEELGIPYSINDSLVAHRALHNHTIFRITSNQINSKNKHGLVAACGMRYSPLSRRLGYRRNTPAVGVFLSYKKKDTRKKVIPKTANPPKFSFVHLGFAAKIKSLKTINDLRRNRIPICHYLTNNRLSGQMYNVEKLKLPYIIIMGQKEALEGTVMIRDTRDHSQETIPLEDLPYYLKKIRSENKKIIKKACPT
ncbi:MAG: His/Gly/Thr/Pro-type tRNA ligase C-terminal domain-containing protein [Patescibacteria group bacterium]